MKKIAIIPARSGSKGIRNKNIIDICGKPMMNHSIEAAINAECFDRVIVSTDSEYYAEIARTAGAEVVYRDESVSNDTATTYMVLEDLLKKIQIDFEYFMLLQPTSPLRDHTHIKEAVSLFESQFSRFDFLASVKEADHPRVLVNPIGEDHSLKFFDTDFSNYRRQAFKDYTPNGAIYIAKPKAYLLQKHFYGAKAFAYIMTDFDSVDVDNELDYRMATLCMEEKLRNGRHQE